MSVRTKYKTARKMAGLTQEAAAEKLFTSERNLRRIENGNQKCSPDLAEEMAKTYGFPWVADSSVSVNYEPLQKAQAVLNYGNEREDVEKIMPRARRILADGVVDESEEEEFEIIKREIMEECSAARDLLYAQ